MNCSSYLEQIRIQSLDTSIISEKTMSEKQFGQKRQSMEKEIRGSLLLPESEFLDHRKIVIDKIFLLNFPQMQRHHSWNLIDTFLTYPLARVVLDQIPCFWSNI